MIIYSLGMLETGEEETWQLMEQMLIDNFQQLQKIDFDQSLAGFSHGTMRKGSTKLWKMFSMCVKINYGQAKNHEDFFLAASYLGKDRDRSSSSDDPELWTLTRDLMLHYI